jgi:hypothetical protein
LSAEPGEADKVETKVYGFRPALETKMDRNHYEVMNELHRIESRMQMDILARRESKMQDVA